MTTIFWLVGLFWGCTTTTTHLSSPFVLKPKHVELTGAYAMQFNGVVIDKSLSSGEVLYERATEEDRRLTEEEFRGLLDTTLAWSLLTPGSSSELVGRVGLTDKILEGIDIGFKTDFSTIKGDVKWQLWENKNGTQALAWSGAYAHQRNLVNSNIAWVTNSTFSRHDFDTALMWGMRKKGIAELYGGPRFMYSYIDAQPDLTSEMSQIIPDQFQNLNPSEYFQDERMMFYGATVGTRIGYHFAFLTLEVNCFWIDFNPYVIDQNRSLSGLLVSPTAAITLVPGEYKHVQQRLENQWQRKL